MNRRALLAGLAALAASTVVPASLAGIASKPATVAAMSVTEGAELAALVMAMSPAKKAVFAALIRRRGSDPASVEFADLLEQLAVQGGWVRGEQHDALLEAFAPCS